MTELYAAKVRPCLLAWSRHWTWATSRPMQVRTRSRHAQLGLVQTFYLGLFKGVQVSGHKALCMFCTLINFCFS